MTEEGDNMGELDPPEKREPEPDRVHPDEPPMPTHVVGLEPPESGTRYSAWEIHDTVAKAAREEMHRPASALWWSALGAGMIICFSFLVGGFLGSLTTNPSLHQALVAAGYPFGFIFVVLASTQLFTENTLDPILPLLEHPSWKHAGRVGRLWFYILAGNLVGAFTMGILLAKTPMLSHELVAELDRVAQESTSGSFAEIFYRAIFAGWLVALMAWLISTTRNTLAQTLFIWATTAPISALGFRHSIAGAVEAFFRVGRGQLSLGSALGGFIAPAALGNIVGGGFLVALLFYGQVSADKRAREQQNGNS